MWAIIVAQTMCKVASAMQREILEGKLISYFTEWCNTPSPRVPGVCYRDYIVAYDRNGEPTQYLNRRSPLNNIYIGIDADYLGFDPDLLQGLIREDMSETELCSVLRGIDPVLISNIDRYTEAMSRTFWSCYDGFEVQQACEALAKRGLNIDMITVVRSSGGVGSSLYSAGLHARLGRQNHLYFDARILTDGEKLRTVIPTMVGRAVYTAQEQPGGRDRIQDDLLKKVATAEGLMGRLPYTILAKLFHLVGWKRFETNKPLHLEPLEHAAFEALLRRFVVIALKARFYDRLYLEKNLPNHEEFGIFARDPTLKDFLESSQGIAASTSVQNQFEVSHGRTACTDIINIYARNGGDKLSSC
jgi:hypothetical protein